MGQEAAEEALSHYSEQVNQLYTDNMAAKLGLLKYDKELALQLLTLMYEAKAGEASTEPHLHKMISQRLRPN